MKGTLKWFMCSLKIKISLQIKTAKLFRCQFNERYRTFLIKIFQKNGKALDWCIETKANSTLQYYFSASLFLANCYWDFSHFNKKKSCQFLLTKKYHNIEIRLLKRTETFLREIYKSCSSTEQKKLLKSSTKQEINSIKRCNQILL